MYGIVPAKPVQSNKSTKLLWQSLIFASRRSETAQEPNHPYPRIGLSFHAFNADFQIIILPEVSGSPYCSFTDASSKVER